MIKIKVILEDGSSKKVKCDPSTSKVEDIKKQIKSKVFNQKDCLCLGDGTIIEEGVVLSTYKIDEKTILHARKVGPNGTLLYADVDNEQDKSVKMSKLRQFLNHFIKRRPSPETLVSAKILPEGSVPKAEDAMPYAKLSVIERTCEWITKNALDVEGIFRIPGGTSEVNVIAQSLLKNNIIFDTKNPDDVNPYDVCGALKVYLREMTKPLIQYRHFKEYMKSYNISTFISALEEPEKTPLIYLMRFLNKVSLLSSVNKMGPKNLAVVFGPSIIRSNEVTTDSFIECDAQINLLTRLITDINTLAPSEAPPAQVEAAAGESAGAGEDDAEHKEEIDYENYYDAGQESCEMSPEEEHFCTSVELPPMTQPCPWYNETMSEAEIGAELSKSEPGTYVIVKSFKKKGCYEAFYKTSHGETMSFVIIRTGQNGEKWRKIDDPFSCFGSVQELVEHYVDAGYWISPLKTPEVVVVAAAAASQTPPPQEPAPQPQPQPQQSEPPQLQQPPQLQVPQRQLSSFQSKYQRPQMKHTTSFLAKRQASQVIQQGPPPQIQSPPQLQTPPQIKHNTSFGGRRPEGTNPQQTPPQLRRQAPPSQPPQLQTPQQMKCQPPLHRPQPPPVPQRQQSQVDSQVQNQQMQMQQRAQLNGFSNSQEQLHSYQEPQIGEEQQQQQQQQQQQVEETSPEQHQAQECYKQNVRTEVQLPYLTPQQMQQQQQQRLQRQTQFGNMFAHQGQQSAPVPQHVSAEQQQKQQQPQMDLQIPQLPQQPPQQQQQPQMDLQVNMQIPQLPQQPQMNLQIPQLPQQPPQQQQQQQQQTDLHVDMQIPQLPQQPQMNLQIPQLPQQPPQMGGQQSVLMQSPEHVPTPTRAPPPPPPPSSSTSVHAAAAAAPAMGGSFGSNDDLLNFVIPPPTLSGSGAGSAADFDDPNFVKKDIEKMMETSPAAKEERAATVKTICDSYSTNKNESLANFNDLDIDTLINYITLVGDDLN